MTAKGKTPYELRAELLQLAFAVCSHNSHCLQSGVSSDRIDTKPRAVSADDIVNVASKFNEFVSKNEVTKGTT